MAGLPVVVEFSDSEALRREFAANLRTGGIFVAGSHALEPQTDCELTLVHPGDGARLSMTATVVMASPAGIALSIIDFGPARRSLIETFIDEHDLLTLAPVDEPSQSPDDEPDANEASDSAEDAARDAAEDQDLDYDEANDESATPERRRLALNLNERLRNLTMVEQHRIARAGDASERVVLERMYGKTVWEAILRNPRVTAPEVARIARMGSLPRPMIEFIVDNAAWVKIGQVRRALLSNPRLSIEQLPRILRHVPKHELKLMHKQTAYPRAVRDAVRRFLNI